MTTKGEHDIVIFFQGEEEASMARPCAELLESVTNHWGTKGDPFFTGKILDRWSELDFSQEIYNNLTDTVDTATAAFALLTWDKRPASIAGCLWMELGHWLARKRRDRLFIFVQNKKIAGQRKNVNEKDWKVKLVPTLPGGIIIEFSSQKDLREKAKDILTALHLEITDIKEKEPDSDKTHETECHVNGDYKLTNKINDVFHCEKRWAPTDLTNWLGSTDAVGDYRTYSMEFICDLIRMARYHREHAEIEVRLRQISDACEIARQQIERGPFGGTKSESKTLSEYKNQNEFKLNEIIAHIIKLRTFCKDFLNHDAMYREAKKQAAEKGEECVDNAWDVLIKILRYRMEIYGKPECQMTLESDPFSLTRLNVQLDSLLSQFSTLSPDTSETEKKKDLGDGEISPLLAYYALGANDTDDPVVTRLIDYLRTMGRDAKEISVVLKELGRFHFGEYRSNFKDELNSINHYHQLPDVFHNITKKMPKEPAIWPRKSAVEQMN
jgi:hypothetical protein